MSKTDLYPLLSKQAGALLEARFGLVSNLANLAAMIYHTLPDINWAGFYLLDKNILRLGPFQGKPACTEIPLGKGVCGTAAQTGQTQLVKNVHEFKGHIACDSASNSEIVVPIFKDGHVWGVLDIDSPVLARFNTEDQAYLEQAVELFTKYSAL